jgi:hypothetical protein
MKKYHIPNTLLKIIAFFIVIDFFALQKPLPVFIGWLLIVIPLVLLATTCFIWAYHKQFPISGHPLFPYFDFDDEFSNILRSTIFGLLFTFLAIMITVSLLSE